MQLIDGRPVYAATDLVGYLACDHRLALERAALVGLVEKPIRNDPTIDLIAKRGIEHEQRYLEDLRDRGLRVVEIEKDGSAVAPLDDPSAAPPRDAGADLRAAAEQTIAAMRSGADVVYQATFFDGTWRGHADFLLRRDHVAGEADSAFGPWHYEVADTKLARHVKASAILQICSYVEQLTAVQGVQPESLHVVLGGRERPTDTLRVEDYMAYYRRVKADFEAAVGLRGDVPATRLSAGRDVPRAGRALRRLPLERRCARRSGAPTTTSASSRAPRRASAARSRRATLRRGAGWPSCRCRWTRSSRASAPGRWSGSRSRRGSRSQSEDRREVLWELLPLDRGADGNPVPGPRPARPARAQRRATCSSTSRATRSRSTTASTTCSASSSRARPRPTRDGLRRRAAGPGVPRVLEHRRRRPGHLGRGEGGVRADDRPASSTASTATRRSTSTTTPPTSGRRSGGSRSATARARRRSTACCGAACSSTCSRRSARASAPASRATRSSGSSRCTRSSARSSSRTPAAASSRSRRGWSWAPSRRSRTASTSSPGSRATTATTS